MTYDEFDRTIFPLMVKTRRLLKGLKQEDMAEILNMKQSMYARYETGKTLPETEILMKMGKVLNIKPLEFFPLNRFSVSEDAAGKHFTFDFSMHENANLRYYYSKDFREKFEKSFYSLSAENKAAVMSYVDALLFDQERDERMSSEIKKCEDNLEVAKSIMKMRKERKKDLEEYNQKKESGIEMELYQEVYGKICRICAKCTNSCNNKCWSYSMTEEYLKSLDEDILRDLLRELSDEIEEQS